MAGGGRGMTRDSLRTDFALERLLANYMAETLARVAIAVARLPLGRLVGLVGAVGWRPEWDCLGGYSTFWSIVLELLGNSDVDRRDVRCRG